MHCRSRLVLLALLGAGLTAGAAPAPDRPVVAGFERLRIADKAADADAGRLLLSELNCTSCHQAGDAGPGRKQAPVLDHVGGRVRVSWLRRFLRDPQATKPGTTMPALFAADPARDEKVEALVHFLASTGSPRSERPRTSAVGTGRDTYHKVGCVACHGSRDAAGKADKVLTTSVPLGDLEAKYTVTSLAAFLEQPHQARPAGRMPKLLDAKEARDVASYLLQNAKGEIAGKGSTTFAYYEGSWGQVPNFDQLKPVATGTAGGFDLGAARRGNDYALRFEGFFAIDREAVYTFILSSDDGSRLSIDGKTVVNNDGIHPPQTRVGSTKLTKGIHKVVVGFMQSGGGAELHVEIEAPGLGRRDLGELVAGSESALVKKPAPKKDDPDYLEIEPQLVEKGKELFTFAGCASCHAMNVDGKPLAPRVAFTTLARLKGKGGCLAEAPPARVPSFHLDETQRSALAAALASPAVSKDPPDVIARTLLTFNCYACHVRSKVGGPGEELDKFFQTTQPEMGEEARVPPPLDGVGAKMNPDYLKQILNNGSRDRPYMHTHMPAFGLDNVGALAEAFAALDKLPVAPEVKFEQTPGRIKAIARHLVAGQAFGCIKCHTFNGHKAEGVQGIDMTLMPRRLRRDWFHAYVAEPQRIRPGTRMPTAFEKGISVLPSILDGKAPTQIEAIWRYLQDGPGAQLPIGMQKGSVVLVPRKGAILYRHYIAGVPPRSIGVGYPERINLAFDIVGLRLGLLWQGPFIDAGLHWNDRGAGAQQPAGDNVLPLPAGPSFAILTTPDATWPTAKAKDVGQRFLGYDLKADDRPLFRYAVGEAVIEDFPNPVAGKEGTLARNLTVSADKAVDDLYFRAAAAGKIEPLEGGWFKIDGTWKIKIEGGEAKVRKSAGKDELIVPVRLSDGKAKIVEEIVW